MSPGFRIDHVSSNLVCDTCSVSCRKCDPMTKKAAKVGPSADAEHSLEAAASNSPGPEQSEGSISMAGPQASSTISARSDTAGDLGSDSSEDSTSTAGPQAGSTSCGSMQTQYDLVSQPGDTELCLPGLPTSYFHGVEWPSRLLPGDNKYLMPPQGFGAIDSIAIVGDTAYLFQITQGRGHDINNFLLVVLAYLPEHLHVEFIWVFPLGMWKKYKFRQGQLPNLTEYLKKTSAQTTALQMRHFGKVASNQELVARRLQECEEQYKTPLVPFKELTAEQPVQGKLIKQNVTEASLRRATGFGGAAASSVRYPSQVRLLVITVQ